ncbi:MAG: CDP-diacylglycerol--serine O-phosphatidyltransferase [Acidimicrobiia bacterium]|nr:CDP-diacylglycerol--serine O-phosphatidyltransferase [Acidimicrobiia bacterium]
MKGLRLKDRLVDPNSPDRRPRKAAYALPTLFTAGNLLLGYLAIMKAFQGAMLAATGATGVNPHLEVSAISIGVAVFLDGLDGRIARLTNTVSDFGRELDSLADVITFGVAPAVLAWVWGFQFADGGLEGELREHFNRAAYFFLFLYLMCGASRLARFNIQVDPVPKNPGRPGRKYFVGLPIPAAAGMVAAVVYASGSEPLRWWPLSVAWLVFMGGLAFLMVSTWRYRSFKDFNLLRPQSPVSVVMLGSLIYLTLNYSHAVLLSMAVCYVGSGVVIRIGGIVKRKLRPPASPPEEAAISNG